MSSSEAEPAEEHPEEPGADQIKEEPLEVAKSKSPESAEERERDVDMNAEHGPAVYGGEAPPAQKSDGANMSPSPRRAAPASPLPSPLRLVRPPPLSLSHQCVCLLRQQKLVDLAGRPVPTTRWLLPERQRPRGKLGGGSQLTMH